MAFQTALSGLNAAQSNLSVIGNNIANSSTSGFKKSRAEFGDIFANSFGGATSTAIGAGVKINNVAQQFAQGNVEFTENSLDLAVSGEGFFVIRDTDGSELYTRAGAFGVDREGYVVNANGQYLQSYPVDDDGVVTSFSPADLQLNTDTSPAGATSLIETNINLDASATAVDPANFDPNDTSTYNFNTSLTVYDSLGTAHTAVMYFVKDSTAAGNDWEVFTAINDADGTTTTFSTDGVDQGSGTASQTVSFDSSGTMTTAMPLTVFSGGYTPSTGAANMTVDIDLGTSTQYAGESTINSLVQDGYTTGRLSGIDIDDNGVVYARYTNGQSSLLGSVAMANFSNPQGLSQVGDTNWASSFDSGDVVYGQANRGALGAIQSGALEASNVDISQQLVNMIVAQRDYQANAKMISTEDQVTQTIINIR